MSNVIVTNLQHCVPEIEKAEYAHYMREKYNVNVIFNNITDFSDELSISGIFDNVQRAIYAYYYNDKSQIEHNCAFML